MSDVPIRLQPGEEIVLDLMLSPWWGFARYVFTLGLWAIWRPRHRIVVTDQRLVIVKGIINKSERSVPLARIQDVQLQTSAFSGGAVQLSTAGGSLGVDAVRQLTRADATALADALSSRIGAASASPT